MTVLDRILGDVRNELSSSKVRRSAADLRGMTADAAPVRDFSGALSQGFGLIAEVKERSPSVGDMRRENVDRAPHAYEESPIVRAVSVLTNATHFGMDIERLAAIRALVSKPVLRKDFILDEYQVREARAFGADAILLMANVLDVARLAGFYDLARELGMQALFEVHTHEEIKLLPSDARIVGINSRKFKSQTGFVEQGENSDKDFSLDLTVFHLAEHLHNGVIKVAESGLYPQNINEVGRHFHAALVGTSLLRDERGPAECLREFESALQNG